MKGMLDPVFEEKVIGHAIVRQLFKASGVGTIAGSYVMDGKFQRGCSVRITREGEQIFEGALASPETFQGRCEGKWQPDTSVDLYLRSSMGCPGRRYGWRHI